MVSPLGYTTELLKQTETSKRDLISFSEGNSRMAINIAVKKS